MEIKVADFPNILALEAWEAVNRVHIISKSEIIDEWGYPTSLRLLRPKIRITYMDWSV